MKKKNTSNSNSATITNFLTHFFLKKKEIKKEKKKCLFEYQKNVEARIHTNPKSFFSYTKSLRKTNKLPPVMKYKGQIIKSLKETAN